MNKSTIIKVSAITPEEIQKFFCNAIVKDFIFRFFSELSQYYSNFENWYNKVMIEVEEKKHGREILLLMNKNEIAGIAILKKTDIEKKICAFRIHEKFRAKGLANELFEASFDYLGTRTPLISIADTSIPKFQYYIEKFDFKLEQQLDGYYQQGHIEFVYNGKLKKELHT